jgi:vacuolar-type H+-ATPase subunit C/Vma6
VGHKEPKDLPGYQVLKAHLEIKAVQEMLDRLEEMHNQANKEQWVQLDLLETQVSKVLRVLLDQLAIQDRVVLLVQSDHQD